MALPIEFTGSFGGFVFTDEGKRRMLLHQTEGDLLLKVPRVLRRRISGKFRAGEPIRVAVVEQRHPETGTLKRFVSQVLPATVDPADADSPPQMFPVSAAACVVRVCSKKSCWRQGGRELHETLQRELAATGWTARVEIRQVGCLDRCKHGPNVDIAGREYARCSPRDAGALLAQALAPYTEPL